MKKFLPLALAGLFIAHVAQADAIEGGVKPYAVCKGYDSESLTLWDTAAVTYKQGVLEMNGETTLLHCTAPAKVANAPVNPDQPEQLFSCVAIDEGPIRVTIQTFGILPVVVGYIANDEGQLTMVGCPTL